MDPRSTYFVPLALNEFISSRSDQDKAQITYVRALLIKMTFSQKFAAEYHRNRPQMEVDTATFISKLM